MPGSTKRVSEHFGTNRGPGIILCRFSDSLGTFRKRARSQMSDTQRRMRSSEVSALLNHTDALFRYAMALSRNPATADDLVQEAYLRALSAKKPLWPESNYKRWLITILRNIWLNELRKGRWTAQTLDTELDGAASHLPADASNDPHLRYVSNLQVTQIRAAIRQLPPEFREIIILREYEELSYQEIAEILQCPAGTVMSRLARARSRLRAILTSQQLEQA